ncbi:MAG: helix-turn-helix domain-containing protein [Nitriliruptoraceae bacterium]
MSDTADVPWCKVSGIGQEGGVVRALSPMTRDAIAVVGQLVASERRRQRRTAADLAARAGISRDTLYRVERGDPTVAIGTALELLVLLGVPLFDTDADGLARQVASGRQVLALLPDRVQPGTREPDDDF